MAGKVGGGKVIALLLGTALWLAVAPGAAQAQTAGLEQLGRWYLAELNWRNRGTLPADNEAAAPLVAQYNWAYGAITMGLNIRARGTNSYYAAIAINDNASLDYLDSVGPANGPALWRAGKYFLAAGLPNGQLVVWLTAPGASPRRIVLTNSYTGGTGFDVAVYPPDPLGTDWAKWFISAAYQNSDSSRGLVVESFTGAGTSQGITSTLQTPGNLVDVRYLDFPLADKSSYTAYTVFTYERDNQPVPGNNTHTGIQAAWYNMSQNQWAPTSFRDTGLYLGNCYLGWKNSAVCALVAFDQSEGASLYGGLQLLNCSANRLNQVATSAAGSCWLPVAPVRNNFYFLESARVASPFTVLSDGQDIYLGWQVQSNRGGNQLEYFHLCLYRGDRQTQGNTELALYPIQGVAAAAHWSTGDPSLYWVQRGSNRGASGGVLYQLVYWAGP
jgi:hypothetical protein